MKTGGVFGVAFFGRIRGNSLDCNVQRSGLVEYEFSLSELM